MYVQVSVMQAAFEPVLRERRFKGVFAGYYVSIPASVVREAGWKVGDRLRLRVEV